MSDKKLTIIQQRFLDEIRDEISDYLEDKYEGVGIKLFYLRHTLAHELGHLEEGIKHGFKFVYVRVGDYVCYINRAGEKDHFTLNRLLKWKLCLRKPKGVCYVYEEREMSQEDLIKAYIEVINGGPKATKVFFDENKDTVIGKKQVHALNKVLELNPAKVTEKSTNKEKFHFRLQSTPLPLPGANFNDQILIKKLIGKNRAKEVESLNNRFKSVDDAIRGTKINKKDIKKHTKIVIKRIKQEEKNKNK